MSAAPQSYTDPTYDRLDRSVEGSLGLPSGLLSSIRLNGEKSNVSQVSSKGARTVYQITPSTRAAVLKQYGIDAYSSAPNAATAAGLLLRDSLSRNDNDPTAAVGEYIGGTDRSNWGPNTRAYIQRVTGGGDPASNPGADTAAAAASFRQSHENQGPDASQFPDIRSVVAAKIQKSTPIPASVIASYNSHKMSDADRAIVDKYVSDGTWFVPKGQALKSPGPRTAGELIGMGTRDLMTGAGGLVDTIAGPANIITNAVTGSHLSTHPTTDLANSAADAMGLPAPESDTEQLNSAAIQGGTQGLLTAGAGVVASPVEGATGAIGRAVSSNPLLDTASGATSGYAQESARQNGAGTAGQIAAGLLGGVAPVSLAATAERAASRLPKTLAEVAAETPRAAVIDEAGNLTPDGQEMAARHGVTPEEVHQAYEVPPTAQDAAANDQVEPQVAREATTGAPDAAVAPGAASPEAEQPEMPPTPNAPDDQSQAPEADAAISPSAEPLPETALQRVEAGNQFGIDYTRGQATKSFDIQDAEQRLRNSNGPEAEQMRQFVANQAEQVKSAVQQFKDAVSPDARLTAEQRGEQVQQAVSDLRDAGKAGVSALYEQARKLGQAVPLETDGIKQAYNRLMVEADVPDGVKKVLTQEAARYGIIGQVRGTSEDGITTVDLAGDPEGGKVRQFYGTPQTLRLDNAEQFRQVVSKQYKPDGPLKLTGLLSKAIDDATEEAATKLAQYGQEGAGVPSALRTARDAHIQQLHTFKAGDVVQNIVAWKNGQEDVTRLLKPEQVMQQALASTSDLKRVKAVLLGKATPQSRAAWQAIQAHGLAEIFGKATTNTTNHGGEIVEAISGAKLRSAIKTFGPDKLRVLLDPADFGTLMKLQRVIEDVTIPITGTVNHSNSGNLMMRLIHNADTRTKAAFAAAGAAVGGHFGAIVGGGVGSMVAPAIKASREAKQAAETIEGITNYSAERAANDTGEKAPSATAQAGAKAKQVAQGTVKAFVETYGSPRILAPVLATTAGAQKQ